MKTVKILGLAMLSACAATSRVYDNYSDWDNDHDGKIQRREFVQVYMNANYFDKWGKGNSSISYDELYLNTFKTMDKNNDAMLGREEFDADVKLFYFGLFSGGFESWDNNGDKFLDNGEFVSNAAKSNLKTLWDTNGDKRISKKELAGGMFYLCDANSDGTVDQQELDNWKAAR